MAFDDGLAHKFKKIIGGRRDESECCCSGLSSHVEFIFQGALQGVNDEDLSPSIFIFNARNSRIIHGLRSLLTMHIDILTGCRAGLPLLRIL